MVLLTVGLVMAAASCHSKQDILEGGRPPDAGLVAKGRAGAGLLGGGAWARLFATDSPVDSVVARYRATSQDHGGQEKLAGADGVRFDAGRDCLYVIPWHADDDLIFPSVGLTSEEIEKLNESEHAFVELQPDDCNYNP
jgi:hypothetical protein